MSSLVRKIQLSLLASIPVVDSNGELLSQEARNAILVEMRRDKQKRKNWGTGARSVAKGSRRGTHKRKVRPPLTAAASKPQPRPIRGRTADGRKLGGAKSLASRTPSMPSHLRFAPSKNDSPVYRKAVAEPAKKAPARKSRAKKEGAAHA